MKRGACAPSEPPSLDAVSRAVSSETQSPLASDAPQLAPLKPRTAFNAHVLIAEDNLVNVEVAQEFLLSLGCTVEIAANGQIAVADFQRGGFDLILMDCQMPEMDGLTATQQIRQVESSTGNKRTPIIAVTANAFAEDRAACLKAGMDDYLSKPFTERQLSEALARWLPRDLNGALIHEARPMTDSDKSSVVALCPADLDTSLLDQLKSSRPQLHHRLLSTYLTYSPKMISALCDAVETGNATALHLAAHSLKSSSANVGARRISSLAKQLERLGESPDLATAAKLAQQLSDEFASVQQAFSRQLEQSTFQTPATCITTSMS